MVKNLPTYVGDTGLISGSGRSPGEGNGNPLQYSCLGNPMDKEAYQLQSMGSQRVRHNLVTERAHKEGLESCCPIHVLRGDHCCEIYVDT